MAWSFFTRTKPRTLLAGTSILQLRNHIHPLSMAVTFKLSVKPSINNHLGQFNPYNPRTQSKNIGVIVLPRELGRVGFGAHYSSNTFNLVSCNGNTNASTTEE